MPKLVFGCSHGRDDAERATLPFLTLMFNGTLE